MQGIIDSLLYYAWAVDNKLLLMTLSSLGTQQATATTKHTAIDQLLDYLTSLFQGTVGLIRYYSVRM